jgi:hypothetical protein
VTPSQNDASVFSDELNFLMIFHFGRFCAFGQQRVLSQRLFSGERRQNVILFRRAHGTVPS